MQLKPKHEQDFETYLQNIGLQPVTSAKHLLYFNHFKVMFGGFITQAAIDSFLSQKTSPNHRAMVKHLLDLLKRDATLTQEEQLEVSRLVILKHVGKKDTAPIRILSKEEIKKIVDGAKLSSDFQTQRFKLMVYFQYCSGLRIDELCRLRWEHLNYQGRTKFYEEGRDKLEYQKLNITSDIAKGGKAASFYVRTDVYLALFDFLKHWKSLNPLTINRVYSNLKPIWGKNKKKYSKEFKEQAFRTLGFKLPDNKSTHILRHSICTHLLQGGMPLLQVRDFMRHDSVATTEKYLHLAQDLVGKALERLKSPQANKGSESEQKEGEVNPLA